ncbi:iron complex outermembrane recepter protein [Fodinibius roseus]|uniref:Iron complex outermembrane recepter protein n=1 Tax=Fodinibius roseus TaxID=1194090 RepID=A0A1M4TCU1_9BACT|nr:TonB-dependent receptor [Fodinibius roseus]SHE42253.1 iron complex outermembrane recepter protein [Fodinibius roseus]
MVLSAGIAFAAPLPLPEPELQTGTLVGTVMDRETSEPISFAYLYLEEANRTITAHSDGTFAFSNIPAGSYTLRTTRIGYRTSTRPVEVTADDTTEVKISLNPTVFSSGAVEVVGTQGNGRGANLEHASQTISGTQLRQNLGSTLSATLDESAGISSRSMGAAPARPVIRGLGGERVLILQDGERTGDVSSQSADHAVTIDPMAAEEIEIARGPAALIYGSNAIGGVVNVVRNQISRSMPDHIHGTATLQGETVNTGGNAAVEAGIPVGSFAVQADLNYRTTGDTETPAGTLENSDLTSTNNALGISYIRPWGYLGGATSMYLNNYGIPPDPEGGHASGVDIEMEKYQLEGASELYLSNSAFRSVTANLSYKHYFHKEIESGGITGTEFGVLTTNASVKAHHRELGVFSKGTMGIWAETKDYAVSGARTPDSDANSFSAFVVEEADWGELHLEAGLRYDFNRMVPAEEDPDSDIGHIRSRTFQALASSLSAIYHAGRGYYIGSTFMHSYRPPSQEELYSEGPHLASYSYEIGNPDLDPERGLGKELFLRYRGDDISVEITGYHNAFANYIYPRNTGRQNTRFPSLNDYQFEGAAARIYGAEASTEIQLFSGIAFNGIFSYTHGERDLTPQEQELNPETPGVQPLPMIPPLKTTVGLTYARGGFQMGGKLRIAANQDRTGDFETPTDGYHTWNMFGQYRFQTGRTLHTIALNAENIFDTTYRNHLSRIKNLMPAPGRNISLLYRTYF